ncbi:hypothetical protein [Shumkonia mesophila]|uniref:hypothetical protein n=1 Tax=Shumkonia mesophila TaxID=2838854 RepID=UPI00293422C4|nr:hypothetical protein [Shumkonia mesophila]
MNDAQKPIDQIYPPVRCATMRAMDAAGEAAAVALGRLSTMQMNDRRGAIQSFMDCRSIVDSICTMEPEPISRDDAVFEAGNKALGFVKKFPDSEEKTAARQAIQAFLALYEERIGVEAEADEWP